MKHKLFKILPFLLLGGVLGLAAAPAAFEAAGVKAEELTNPVVFSNFADQGKSDGGKGSSISYNHDNITVSSSGGYGTNGNFRLYNGKTLNISSKNYEISKVDFTFNGSDKGNLSASYTVEPASKTWSVTNTGGAKAEIKTISITLSIEDIVLSSLTVDTSKATTTFSKGQSLDLTGLKVNGTKVSGGTVDVTSQCTFSPAAGTKLDTVGSTTINVTYAGTNTPATETGEDLTTSYNVIVSDGPSKAVYTKVTTNSLKANDKVILVDSANKLAATKGLTSNTNAGKHYLDRTAVTIEGNDASFDPDSDVCVFTVAAGKLANTYALINEEGKYLGAYSTSYPGLKYETSVTNNSSWTIDIENTNPKWAIKANHNSAPTVDSEIYLMSGVDMRLCKAGSGNGAIDIYKYSSGNERVTLDASTKEVYEKYTTTISATEVEFEPTSWAWESSNTEFVSIFGNANTATITVKGEAPGSSNLTVTANGKYKATCVVTCKSAGSLVIEPGSYFITDLTNKYMMGSDLSNVDDVSISQPQNLYTFEFAGLGDGTYWVSNAEGKYLAFRQNVIPDGKRVSEMTLTDEKVDYWTITKNANNQYKVATQYGTKTKSITQDGDLDWLAFDGNNYVNLTKQGTLKEFRVGHEPQYKKYYVGEKFKTTGLIVYAVYMVDGTEFLADVTTKIVWDELEAGTVATGTYSIGDDAYEVRVHGLSILGPVEGSMVVEGLKDTYLVGEVPAKTIKSVKVTYSDGSNEEQKILTGKDFKVKPDKISSTTEKVVVEMVIDPNVKVEQDITVEHAKYFATPIIEIGDKVTLGTTVGAKDGNITGGSEFAIVDGKPGSVEFGYLPTPEMEFEVVQGVSAGSFAFKYNGNYLTSNGKTLDFGHVSNITGYYDEGKLCFDYPYFLDGVDEPLYIHFVEDEYIDDAFNGTLYDYEHNIQIYGPAIFADETTMMFDLDVFQPISTMNPTKLEFERQYEFNGELIIYLPSEGGVNTKNSFTCTYVQSQNDMDDYWKICPLNEPQLHVYFNEDSAKFGVGTNVDYNAMLYRDMSKDFKNNLKSISVSVPESVPTTVTLGGTFNWVGIKVKAVIGNKTISLPLGAYEVEVPALDSYGEKTCTVTYGVDSYKKTATFKIHVVGNYQPFIKQDFVELWVDDTYTFTTTQEPPEGQPVTWSSSDPTVASFADPLVGDLKVHKSGKVKVTVTSYDGYYSNTKEFNVSQRPTGLTLDITEKTIKQGEKFTITGTVLPSDAKNKTVLWSTSDSEIATVNSKGEVSGLGIGDVVITGQTQGKGTGEEEGYKATCLVHVEQGEVTRVTGVSLSSTTKEIKVGASATLTAIIEPADATEKGVTWTSKYPDIVLVDKNGNVTGKRKGTSDVTVTTLDGGYTATCRVTVKDNATPVQVTSITLDEDNINIEATEEFVLTATINPIDADDKTIQWTSDNIDIATVTYVGPGQAKVVGVSDGQATITATTSNGKTATCRVTVGEPISPTSVTLNETEKEINVGEKVTLVATVSPTEAYNKAVTWSSSDKTVATVDSTGHVKAIAAGECDITVKTVDGGKTAVCHIKVVDPNGKKDDDNKNKNIIILAATIGGLAVVGTGCGVGIPLAVKASKRRKQLNK